jgi:MoaA/NifB/PqqE/SkfB family radical SAM enzyme
MVGKTEKISLALDLLRIKLTKKYKPLIVSWPITHRCNKRCKYCNMDKINHSELDTKQSLNLIDDLTDKGTRVLTITGGEPTLRKDLPEILRYAKSKGMLLFLNTNGAYLNKELLSLVDRITLSLDGSEILNDKIRGKGSYKDVIDAIKLCKKSKVFVTITCVITKKNVNRIEDILKFGQANNINIVFQPVTLTHVGKPIDKDLFPTNDELRKAVKSMLDGKKQGMLAGNSIDTIRHLSNYPLGKDIGCISGKIYLRLSPEGYIGSCGAHATIKKKITEVSNDELENLLNKPNCRECWCPNLIELNKVYNLRLGSLYHLLKSSLF